jgi:hypothetical protein
MTQIPREDPAIDTKVLLGTLYLKDIIKRRGGDLCSRNNVVNELWDSINLDSAGTDYVKISKLDAAALAQVWLPTRVRMIFHEGQSADEVLDTGNTRWRVWTD